MEQDAQSSPMQAEVSSHRNAEHATDSLDETAAENSIIGNLRSRVSSILPNSLSKWFSPSTKNRNDSFNGNLHNSVGGIGRRRRRLEMEDDDEEYIDDDEEEDVDDDDADDEPEVDEYEDNIFPNRQENSDDDSSNSEATASGSDRSPTSSHNIKNAKSSVSDRQPPKKRSRLNLDNSTSNKTRNIPLMARPPLVASTPGYGAGGGDGSTRYTSSSLGRPVNRYTHLNLYAGQTKKEPAYNFNLSPNTMTKTKTLSRYNDPDIIDLVPEEAIENCMRSGESGHIGSRRTLNIPPTTITATATAIPFRNCKRQSSSDTPNQTNTSAALSHARPRRTSTTIFEADSNVLADATIMRTSRHQLRSAIAALPEEFEVNDNDDDDDDDEDYVNEVDVGEVRETNVYNGKAEEEVIITSKRQKLINGSDDVNIRDSVSESSDATSKPENVGTGRSCSLAQPKTTGLFNMSAVGGRRNGNGNGDGSRSSSFGNSLNFYTHLEGRKSLFADGNGKRSEKNGAQALNSSTLSLTSLNRRQFNASIYGSTSALSDSRLLNTFSPFYKGRTTYGGAAAYKKYSATGASSVRITPTLIRPTSSLSTLSSSNNSLNHAGTLGTENPSGISSTAKRILDLINDFSTPLSEAKKMASNLKTSHNQQQQQQQQQHQTATKLRRFNETDLNATRAMRLSQVRTPYARPPVTLQPKNKLSNSTLLPPIRELQVPSMSQLLQMKKLQNTTERSRLIVKENSNSRVGAASSLLAEYTLPTNLEDPDANRKQQKQHTNKIRSKVTSSGRIAAGSSKDMAAAGVLNNDAPLNLPNIAFPLMESVPKFDIELPAAKSVSKAATVSSASAFKSVEGMKSTAEMNAASNVVLKEKVGLTISTNTPSNFNAVALASVDTPSPARKINFKFSMPLPLDGVCTATSSLISPINDNYKFSAPLSVDPNEAEAKTIINTKGVLAAKPTTPQLKTGSVLDALKKPFLMPGGVNAAAMNGKSDSLFAQFKRPTDEWVCSTCMVPNKKDALKCVACETARKNVANTSLLSTSNVREPEAASLPGSGFGNQFKKSSNEWDCKVCLIRNKAELTKCAACETPHERTTNIAGNAKIKSSSPAAAVTTGSSFGESFKPKANTWECPTCLIYNKQTSNECVACGTKKLEGRSDSRETGCHASNASSSSSASASFRQLAAAQSISKWECDVCMTRNDEARLKCVCCEQAKPGTLLTANAPKFSFGSTAAAKFSFGFGNQNTPKEEELRKQKVENTPQEGEKSVVPPTKGGMTFSFGSTEAAKINNTGFSFGVKPAVDETDAKKAVAPIAAKKEEAVALTSASILPTQFKFGDAAAATATTATTTSAGGFSFGTNAATTSAPTTTRTNDSLFNSPKTKESSATTTTVFGSSSSQSPVITFKPTQQSSSPTVSSFTFGQAKPADDATKSATAEVPKSASIVFKPVDTTTSITTTAVSSSKNTFTFGATPKTMESSTLASGIKTAEAMKPLFSFGSSNSALSSASATSSSAAPKSTPAGFSFGNIAAASSTSSTTPLKTSFFVGAPAAAGTTNKSSVPQTTTVVLPLTTTPNVTSSNIFGSFTAAAGSTTLNNSFNNTQPACVSSAVNTASSFGTVASAGSPSIFGAFSSNESNAVQSKAIASPSVFGAPSSPQTKGPFSFNAKTATTNADNTRVPATTATTTTSATTSWPKNSFVFGSSSTLSAAASSTTTSDVNKVQGFGNSFSSSLAPSATNSPAAAASIFGSNVQGSSMNMPAAAATFGSSLFGAASAPVAAGVASTNNLFGSVTTSLSAPSAFGSSAFGNNSSSMAEPKFGSTAPPSASAPNAPSSFGSFGSVAAASSTTGDGASAAKKSEPAFNFGAAPAAASQATSGGFNFGGNVAKPAFNFGASTGAVANFNFTGTTTESAKSTQPFQFGAAAAPLQPVFNFSSGAVEATPNAPFQFNAGGTQPAPSNIFAPTPTPAGAPSGQQARRKIRAPMRRLTPR